MVSDNIVSNNGLGGIGLHTHAPGSSVSQNVITNNTLSGNAPDFGVTKTPTGIDIGAVGSAITDTVISGNTISNEAIGINLTDLATDTALGSNQNSAKSPVVKPFSPPKALAGAPMGDAFFWYGTKPTQSTGSIWIAKYHDGSLVTTFPDRCPFSNAIRWPNSPNDQDLTGKQNCEAHPEKGGFSKRDSPPKFGHGRKKKASGQCPEALGVAIPRVSDGNGARPTALPLRSARWGREAAIR